MAGSASERAIRDAVAAFLRREMPKARIVHELVCGGSRADLAAVERERLLLFEVKSEKDVLARLPTQLRDFTGAAHGVVLIAHAKWFDQSPYDSGKERLAWPHRAVPIADWPREIDEPVLIFVEHPNLAFARDEAERDRWRGWFKASWTDFNGGGWVWYGMIGAVTHVMPDIDDPASPCFRGGEM